MENGINRTQEPPAGQGVRCPICAHPNTPSGRCRHVRWTFDQGGPIDFAVFVVETSPYSKARGYEARSISKSWWEENAEWVVGQVILHFEAAEGYVFGEVADLDLLARDLWRGVNPQAARPQMSRVDLF